MLAEGKLLVKTAGQGTLQGILQGILQALIQSQPGERFLEVHPHPQSGGKPAPCEGKQKELGKGQEELRERQEDALGGDEEEPQGGKEGLTLWNGATHPRQLWECPGWCSGCFCCHKWDCRHWHRLLNWDLWL